MHRHDEETKVHCILRAPAPVNSRVNSRLIRLTIYLPRVFRYCTPRELIFVQRQVSGASNMLNHIKRFIKNESGGTAIEYGLIASGVAVAIIPSVDKVGQKLVQVFTSIQSALP